MMAKSTDTVCLVCGLPIFDMVEHLDVYHCIDALMTENDRLRIKLAEKEEEFPTLPVTAESTGECAYCGCIPCGCGG